MHPKKGFHPSAWKGYLSEGRARLRVVASCSVGGKSRFAKQVLGEETDVGRSRREQGRRSTVIETFNNPYTPQTEVDVLAPGYIAHAPWLPGPLDLEGWSQFTAVFVEAFPDLRLTVEDIFSGGDMVAARVAFPGTPRGEFQGIPPTEKQVAFSSIKIDRMVDGKVEEALVRDGPARSDAAAWRHPRARAVRRSQPNLACRLFIRPRGRGVLGRSVASRRSS